MDMDTFKGLFIILFFLSNWLSEFHFHMWLSYTHMAQFLQQSFGTKGFLYFVYTAYMGTYSYRRQL